MSRYISYRKFTYTYTNSPIYSKKVSPFYKSYKFGTISSRDRNAYEYGKWDYFKRNTRFFRFTRIHARISGTHARSLIHFLDKAAFSDGNESTMQNIIGARDGFFNIYNKIILLFVSFRKNDNTMTNAISLYRVLIKSWSARFFHNSRI